MNSHLRNKAALTLSALLALSATFTLSAKTTAKVNPFSYIPSQSNIIGSLNLDKIKKIKSVNDAINKTQNDPMYHCLKLSGLTAENIAAVYFGMHIEKVDQDSVPSFVSLLRTNSPYNLDKFISESKTLEGVKISSEKYGKNTIYNFLNTNSEEKQDPVYFAKLSEDLLVIGSDDFIKKSMDLLSDSSNSVLSNKELMNLTGNTQNNNMLWVAAILPEMTTPEKPANEKKAPENKMPDINNGMIALNYEDSTLVISGQLNCASKEDVQKILLPAQMFLGIFAMNPDNGIKPEDISLKPEDKKININVKIPEKAIANLLKAQSEKENVSSSEHTPETGAPKTETVPTA